MVVLFGLITAFSWAFANVFTQQATRTRTKPAVIMFWVLLVTTAAILPLAEEVVQNASAGLFSLTNPDHAWSEQLRTIAQRVSG